MSYVPFWDAAYQGDLLRMREIIAADPAVVNKHPPVWKSAYQPTALAYAVWGNRPAAVRLLLENGANPNLADGVSLRPLQHPGTLAMSEPAHSTHVCARHRTTTTTRCTGPATRATTPSAPSSSSTQAPT